MFFKKLAGQGLCEIILYVPQRVWNNWVLKFHETYLEAKKQYPHYQIPHFWFIDNTYEYT
jgi:hypothetical protein